MSDHKIQVIVKSYDKTEFRTEVSVEEGRKLIDQLKNDRIKNRRTKGLKVGDRVYSSDGIWFPFESIEAYLEEYPDSKYVLTGKIKRFVQDFNKDNEEEVKALEDYQGVSPVYLVGKVVFAEIAALEKLEKGAVE